MECRLCCPQCSPPSRLHHSLPSSGHLRCVFCTLSTPPSQLQNHNTCQLQLFLQVLMQQSLTCLAFSRPRRAAHTIAKHKACAGTWHKWQLYLSSIPCQGEQRSGVLLDLVHIQCNSWKHCVCSMQISITIALVQSAAAHGPEQARQLSTQDM